MAADNITKTIWNKAHYDYIAVCVVKGSREQVAAIAKAKGYSLSVHQTPDYRGQPRKCRYFGNLGGG